MKNDIDTENMDMNPFESPANLWDRVEAGLDQKKAKRRGIVWWKIAAGIALLGGISGAVSLFQSTNIEPKNNVTSEVKLPVIQEDSTNQKEMVSDDSTSEKKEFEFVKIVPLAASPEEQIDSLKITSAVPFLMATPAPLTMNNTYQWTSPQNPFGSGGTGGGSGSGAGSGFGTNSVTTALAATPGVTMQGFSNSTTNTNQGRINLISNGGPVNVPTNGVLDGVYIAEHIPTKRMIPYKTLRESNGTYGIADSISFDLGEFGLDQTHSSRYATIQENIFKPTSKDPLSTFSIDVDGASYSDVRGMINRNEFPNPNAVRLEEFINYFPYDYPEPNNEHPFSINTEFSECPWNPAHQLLKIGIKGESIEKTQLPTNNLVFLLDVSGSMNSSEKLELLKKGFRLLVNELREEDRVAIAVYAGAAGLVLPPTSGENKDQIMDALNRLSAGGSTAGGEGINLAYATAEKHFDPKGNNRIILATDGDFNVGVSNDKDLVKLIEEKRESGVFLTVLGFGHDNFQSDKMEKLANNGNGNFSFIDNILEAKKVLVTEMGATLKTIAKDVKIQVEFNPNYVSSYRLLGYENRMLEHKDFANDKVDAGELGAGHTVTAVYEIIPPGAADAENPNEDEPELKYSKVELNTNGSFETELATVKFRYKEPDGTKSKLIEQAIFKTQEMAPSNDFKFVQAVIEFGLILRGSHYAGTANFDDILQRANEAIGDDKFGYRHEFITIVEKAKLLADPILE